MCKFIVQLFDAGSKVKKSLLTDNQKEYIICIRIYLHKHIKSQHFCCDFITNNERLEKINKIF